MSLTNITPEGRYYNEEDFKLHLNQVLPTGWKYKMWYSHESKEWHIRVEVIISSQLVDIQLYSISQTDESAKAVEVMEQIKLLVQEATQ